jgi:hypothetical protein
VKDKTSGVAGREDGEQHDQDQTPGGGGGGRDDVDDDDVDDKPSGGSGAGRDDEDDQHQVVEQIELATGRVVALHNSTSAAGRVLHCRHELIQAICQGRMSDEKFAAYSFRHAHAVPPGRQRRPVPIERVERVTGRVVETYGNLVAAGRALGCKPELIASLVKGQLNLIKGFTFRLKNASGTGHLAQFIEQIDVKTWRVVATHASYSAAGRAMKCTRRLISDIVNGEMKKIEGYTFRIASSVVGLVIEPPAPTPVEQVEIATGNVVATHASFKAAGKALKCDHRMIGDICNGAMKYIEGYTFRARVRKNAPNPNSPIEGLEDGTTLQDLSAPQQRRIGPSHPRTRQPHPKGVGDQMTTKKSQSVINADNNFSDVIEEEQDQERNLTRLPQDYRAEFGTIGFGKWGSRWLPTLVVDPSEFASGKVRSQYQEMCEKVRFILLFGRLDD